LLPADIRTDISACRKLELLAPARDVSIAREAILHGADAVYIGGPSHGARAAAANSVADIASLVRFAHVFGVRVYVTLNTIIYDSELETVRATVWELYRAGVDALIVQDMSLLRMHLPPIALHASTQCDIRDVSKARFLAACGFSQLVLARELSAREISEIRDAVPAGIGLEAFVHGALCVSYSGDCQASCIALGRSANRGECAQMCRMAYDLEDAYGNVLVKNKHLLSLRDLNRLPDVGAMADAGVNSFKIEGRLKDAAYVKNTVAAYRAALDKVIADAPGRFCRSSWGRSSVSFVPDVAKSFNRGFTSYFFSGRPAESVRMASLDTPKWVGEKVGRVTGCAGKSVTADLTTELHNGDGIVYFTAEGEFSGFRANRVEGNRLFPAVPVNIRRGTVLYRNSDAVRDSMLSKPTARRRLRVDMTLRRVSVDKVALRLVCENGSDVEVIVEAGTQAAQSPQAPARRRALDKMGATVFEVARYADYVPEDEFIPASVLSALRRQAVDRLTQAIQVNYSYDYRRPEDADAELPHGSKLTYHDNVANRLADAFYRSHGAAVVDMALETLSPGKRANAADVVMTTRYCLRRELGCCLRDNPRGNSAIPPDAQLYLRNRTGRYALRFDCTACRMQVLSL